MADEDIIRVWAEALENYREIVETAADQQTKFNTRMMANSKALEDMAKGVRQGTVTIKEYEQKKAAYEDRAIKSARSYAQAQLDAEKETRTLAYRFQKAAGASIDNQKALLRLEGGLKKAGAVIGEMGGAAAKFASNLASGDTKFTSLNPIIDGVSGALGKMAESIPYAGSAISGALKLAAEGAKFMNQQLQTAVDTFQELSAVGALTTKGMSGVQQQFLQSGMSLQGFRKTVVENSATLARFEGITGRGAERFSQIVGTIVDSEVGEQLRRLGFSADAIGETAAGFLEQQTRLGMTQNRTNLQLAKGSAEYAQQLDALAKVTGMQRQEIEKQQQAALSESRFRAKIDELNAQGRRAEAKALLDLQTIASKASPALAQGLRDLATGNATTEAAQQVLRMGGQEILDQVEQGMLGPVDAARLLQNRFREMAPMMRDLAKAVGDETGAFTKYAEFSDFMNAKILDSGEIVIEQNKQMAKGNDKLTDNAVGAQKAMEQMARQMNNLAFTILPNFASVVSTMTTTMRKGLEAMGVSVPSAVGGAGAAAGGGGGGGGRTTRGQRAATPAVGGAGPTAPAIGRGGGGGGALGAAGGALPTTQGAGIRPTPEAGAAAATLPMIRDLIAGVESRGDYNVVVGGAKFPLTTMTVAEVMALQKKLISEGKDSAAGKYQIKYSTLAGIMGSAGVGRDDKFDQSTQDKLANALIMGRGFNQYAANPTQEGKERFLANLAREWAGLPGGPSGESYYKGTGNNKAGIGWQQALASFQTGGIASGPSSGYTALLHGSEAVVPLPDGKTIPVEMPNLDRSMEQQVGMMGAQLVALEELVRYMRENTSISAKILQAAHN